MREWKQSEFIVYIYTIVKEQTNCIITRRVCCGSLPAETRTMSLMAPEPLGLSSSAWEGLQRACPLWVSPL